MFTLMEIIDILVMTLAVGYIFKDVFSFHKIHDTADIVLHRGKRLDLEAFKFACAVTAPAIILHELGHKFVAMSYGLTAEFHAAYFWLGFGVIMKLLNTGFIFFVPAYVSTYGSTLLQGSLISGAGPAVNLLIWLSAILVLKYGNVKKRATLVFWVMKKQINLFLFIFNMIPIGFFDGANIVSGLFRVLFG